MKAYKKKKFKGYQDVDKLLESENVLDLQEGNTITQNSKPVGENVWEIVFICLERENLKIFRRNIYPISTKKQNVISINLVIWSHITMNEHELNVA